MIKKITLYITPKTTLKALIKLFKGGISSKGGDFVLWSGSDTLSPTIIKRGVENFKAYISSLEKGFLPHDEALLLKEFFKADPDREAICAVYENAHLPFERGGKTKLFYKTKEEYFRLLLSSIQRIHLLSHPRKKVQSITYFEIMAQIFKDFFKISQAEQLMNYDPSQYNQEKDLPEVLESIHNSWEGRLTREI